MPVSNPSNQGLDSILAPTAVSAWQMFVNLLDSLEIACAMGDKQRAEQIWIPIQATNSDLLSYFRSLVDSVETTNGG